MLARQSRPIPQPVQCRAYLAADPGDRSSQPAQSACSIRHDDAWPSAR